ncbi:hypothetical protein FJT64_022827 [Amphibalanus amphitrite]|uniref:Uncharacterized protein n=1 Tax=Amphibalanus amphitrite TaxID=1232801 RepID=A0A6A4WP70_AMPAM|nr:hypothetical protein FJT64_022827 [Amphibalanus amphitrite]
MEALLRAGLVAGSELVDVDRGAAIYSFHRGRQQELQMSLCHPSGQASIHLVEAERETVKLTAPLEHGRWEACGADDGCGSWSRHGSLLEVESQTGDWEGLHPGGGVGLCGSKKTHPDHLVCPIQQTLLRRLRERLIPSALLALF